MTDSLKNEIGRNGFALLAGVYGDGEIDHILSELLPALQRLQEEAESVRSRAGCVYAARNVLSLYPAAGGIWQKPRLLQLLGAVLGSDIGLVRVLYFDKPPDRTWTLPWHKDLSIAVQPTGVDAASDYRLSYKAGVPHVEAPVSVLHSMLTLRLHLDAVTAENGPLKIVAGSHQTGKRLTLDDGPHRSILAGRGDVLAMRPLVSHCSGRSAAGISQHRRILHFEFSGMRDLPDGLQWHRFIPPGHEDR